LIIDFENITYLRLLLGVEGIGPQKILNLLTKFDNLKSILDSPIVRLMQVEGISNKLAYRIHNCRKSLGDSTEILKIEIDRLEKLNAKIITYWDSDYPEILKKIFYPPLIIYVLGNLNFRDNTSVSVVGTRQPSTYGKNMAEFFSRELVNKNLTIISGLARGIDSIAHETALKSGGRTIAVIGSGIDIIYPPENKKLFEKIKENGAVISEFELGTKPDAQNFPRRNRIISGMSLGTLVIETRLTGGAMQTAAYALDQNREIFAVPGNINIKQSEGPNSLIQRGEAKLVMCADDILQELNLRPEKSSSAYKPIPNFELNLFEGKILNSLSSEPQYIDELAAATALNTSDCLINLLTLEFKGLVKQMPGKMFIRL
jgi:DNA processing protein